MKHVIFLAPHFPANQRRFVQGLKNVGARVTGVCDSPPEALDPEIRGMLDDFEQVGNVCSVSQVTDAVRRVQRRGPWVHHLEAAVEAHLLCAAEVREACGIPGMPLEVIVRCRDKVAMKAHLRERGFPVARDRAVSAAASARAFAQEVGFPIVLKPRDGAGASHTYRLLSMADLDRALAETGIDRGMGNYTLEEFLTGHEAFYDTLTVGGRPGYDFVSHYYPNVLPAMRDRDVPAYLVTTNRVESAPGYVELRTFGRRVIEAMGITTSATHMEWFFGEKGLRFSEIGARPPGVSVWDLYSAANDVDLYTEWARAICHGDVQASLSRRFSGGLLSIRPTADGIVRAHEGVDEVQRRWGQHILKSHLPPVGSRTQPIEAGYRANGWVYALHPDFDGCREMLEDIGRTLRIVAG